MAEASKLKHAFDILFHSGNSLSKLRDAAVLDRLFSDSDSNDRDNHLEVFGRSIAWKLFLIPDEPLRDSADELNPNSLLESLRSSRKQYVDELSDKMRAPDGSYPEGFVLPGSNTIPQRERKINTDNLERNNPLSLDNDNPWKEWFASLELRKTILQDVERTFPEIDFFRNTEVQEQLTNVLYLYSVMNSDIGYRQGMHELLAPLYYAVDVDAVADGEPDSVHDPVAVEICSRTWVAADAWILFEAVMRSVSPWYEWREPADVSGPSSSSNSKVPLSNHVHLNNPPPPNGRLEIKPYITPIVQACNNIQSNLLRTIDPALWKHLQSTGIEPQIYGIRWLRLLFTREFNMPDAMKLWDGLFACDPSFELAPWICVAMLIRIRNDLIPSDYTGQLTALLRYPAPPPRLQNVATLHHTSLLLQQALALQMSPTPSTGVSIVMDNRNQLDIPMEVPEPPPAPARRRPPSHNRVQSSQSKGKDIHHRQQGPSSPASQQYGFSEMIARGLMERGESLGINKTLMSAVTELRRNIPELSSLVRSTPHTPSSFPLVDEVPPEERPPWEPRSRMNKRLGESIAWAVDTLLLDESSATDAQSLKKRKQEALEAMSYVRDVLTTGANAALDEERMFGEEEFAKRRAKARSEVDKKAKAAEDPQSAYFVAAPKPPAAVSVVSKPKTIGPGFRASSKSFSPPTSPAAAAATSPPPIPSSGSYFSPPAASMPSSSNVNSRLAPWNYTKSGFGGDSPLPATSLPRPPPPTSSSRPSLVGSGLSISSPNESERPQPRRQATPDPLGVLK
ncbi:RabGAP/TBC [Dendrothele bispora CBS 962.96]|uniref:RabGAP/TBC n=1 Tax=Dendrothele bispora (strain CBS 962.96) TaxID=1314807 RepID=A0A4S8MA69_DENBC|nr:RabGAP/TBC [Dendrothele bispora CBS 962.96]